ncbi:DUF523 domain-containing protein [Actinomadura graeca]|uniref:DUF523 domain-containing protein n=1 Tax=Actinomadura graeca TaxID=2750812 RepID=UPI001E47578B|nr:DUF523 domain-containing protein [Actinomadura graeca]
MERILVSSCLMGRPVRYDGRAKPVVGDLFERWRAEGRLVPFCPEVAGGLPVPRPPAEIVGSRVLTEDGRDVTDAFQRGARLALEIARRAGARIALLKEGSPSCGGTRVHDGTFTGRSTAGEGLTAALLRSSGIRVFPETDLAAVASLLAEWETH